MNDHSLYIKIAENIRQEILKGLLKPGDRLKPVRDMSAELGCTPGTVQRAYKELSKQGLIVSRPGKGTIVSGAPTATDQKVEVSLRKAVLVNRAESFLLELLTNGYLLPEIQQAMDLAQDRWRSTHIEPPKTPLDLVRFSGSHDMVVNGIASEFGRIYPRGAISVNYCGSIGGLIALAAGEADVAGAHLWDVGTNMYNIPYLQKIIPARKMEVYTLAYRKIGFIVQGGNPLVIESLQDLSRPKLRFVNRQKGSGTRVWLDAQLEKLGIKGENIHGYDDERLTHSDVARCVAENTADVGLGLESAALAFGLDFVFLTDERYDLIFLEEALNRPAVKGLVSWLVSPESMRFVERYRGYDNKHTGQRLI